MRLLRAILAAIDRVSLAMSGVAAICLALLAALILTEIAWVATTGQSLTFIWEYGSFLMAAVFFLGLAHTLRTGGHVRVSLLAEHLPPRGARALDLIATGLALWISVVISSAFVRFAWDSWDRGALSFTPTATPLWIPQSVIAFGAVWLTVQLAARLVRLLIGEAPDRPPAEAIASEH